eukprot:13789868-Alexandrium_andersonii.AAC.1
MAAFSLYVTEEGDPTRLRALCVPEAVLTTWVKHIRFLMLARVNDREFTTSCIPVYDILTLAA